jgi:hypothetical protein
MESWVWQTPRCYALPSSRCFSGASVTNSGLSYDSATTRMVKAGRRGTLELVVAVAGGISVSSETFLREA